MAFQPLDNQRPILLSGSLQQNVSSVPGWQNAQTPLALTRCRPGVASNPYVIMVILVAWSWLVGLLSLAPYKCELTFVRDASA